MTIAIATWLKILRAHIQFFADNLWCLPLIQTHLTVRLCFLFIWLTGYYSNLVHCDNPLYVYFPNRSFERGHVRWCIIIFCITTTSAYFEQQYTVHLWKCSAFYGHLFYDILVFDPNPNPNKTFVFTYCLSVICFFILHSTGCDSSILYPILNPNVGML